MFRNRPVSLTVLAFLASMLFWPQVAKTANDPMFTDYPATETFSGAPAAFDGTAAVWSAMRPVIRAMIRDDVARGANFAGAYRLVTVGCGTGCENIFAIDLRNGKIIDAPIAASYGVAFRIDSRLIIVKEDPVYKEPPHYLILQRGKISEIR